MMANSRHPSKGVTPSGNVPLPSTSNFLVGASSGFAGVLPELRQSQQIAPTTKRFQQTMTLKNLHDTLRQQKDEATGSGVLLTAEKKGADSYRLEAPV
jgi:hypothetical protein